MFYTQEEINGLEKWITSYENWDETIKEYQKERSAVGGFSDYPIKPHEIIFLNQKIYIPHKRFIKGFNPETLIMTEMEELRYNNGLEFLERLQKNYLYQSNDFLCYQMCKAIYKHRNQEMPTKQ